MTAPIPAWINGTLCAVDKIDVHRRGLRHPAVSVFVLDGPRMLLQRRAESKYHTPGLWANTCCTHPHWAEAPEACARRRLREELGLEGLRLVHRGRIEYRASVGGGMTEHEVVDLFSAPIPTAGLRLAPDPTEVAEVRWLALPDLQAEIADAPERFTPWLRIYVSRHAEAIFGPQAHETFK